MQGSHAVIVFPYLMGGVAVAVAGAAMPGRTGVWICRLGTWMWLLAAGVGFAFLGVSAYAYWIDVHPDSAYPVAGFMVTLAVALGGIWAQQQDDGVVEDDDGGSHVLSPLPLPRPTLPPLAPGPLPPGSDWESFEALRGEWAGDRSADPAHTPDPV